MGIAKEAVIGSMFVPVGRPRAWWMAGDKDRAKMLAIMGAYRWTYRRHAEMAGCASRSGREGTFEGLCDCPFAWWVSITRGMSHVVVSFACSRPPLGLGSFVAHRQPWKRPPFV